MEKEITRIDIKEFREKGYLQEVNRWFLHPLGMALEVVVEDDGSERLGGVWDYRNDPEGIFYADDVDLEPKAFFVEAQWKERQPIRIAALGYMVQRAKP